MGFAFCWLMPRLARFSQTWPEVTLNQVVTDEPVNFSDGHVDLAVRYGAGQWAGQACHYLFGDRIYPVSSPSFLKAAGVPSTIADLADGPLIESHGIPGDNWLDWTAWFDYVGHRAAGMHARHLNYLIGVQMAMNGKGYALGWHSLVGNLVANGQLVKPLDIEIRSPGAFFITSPVGRPLGSDTAKFADWLIGEASA